MSEFEEFEGLGELNMDDIVIDDVDEDDATFKPVNAQSLPANDLYYEVSFRPCLYYSV